ncbi:MAG TPA: hypothetical protein VEB64_01940 [Azospirillaceae bacterium]|nr:hypothetical protein [Azospirillaceae bacterium]
MFGKATFFWLALAAGAGVVLFKTSYEVQALHDQLSALDREIVQEQESIKVLKAEWAYLNDPQRIEMLAHQFLPTMKPLTAEQMVAAFDPLPLRTVPLVTPPPSATPPLPMPMPMPMPMPVAPAVPSLPVARPVQVAPAADVEDAEEAAIASVSADMLEEARATAAPVTTPAPAPAPQRKPNKTKAATVRNDDAIGMLLVKLGAGQQ